MTTLGWIAMKFGTDIHAPLRMNCNNSPDSPEAKLVEIKSLSLLSVAKSFFFSSFHFEMKN